MHKSAKLNRRAGPARLVRVGVALIGLLLFASSLNRCVAAEEPGETPQPAAAEKLDAPANSEIQPAPAPPAATGGAVQYVGPDTYILLDAEGRPQQMPGMTYEDFLAVWKKLNQPATNATLSSYSIEAATFEGKAVDQRAELDCRVRVRILTTGAVHVPLGLVGAILQGEPRFEATQRIEGAVAPTPPESRADSSRSEYLTYNAENGGYVVRLDGEAGDTREVTFHVVVPLQHDGAETTLPLNCPHTLSSELVLHIASAVTEARVSSGTIVSQKADTDGGTTIKVAGPAGLCRLTWQTATKDAPAIGAALNALSAIHVTVDGRGIRTDARLTVRSYGGGFEQFRVRLPVGAQLVQAASDASQPEKNEYRIRVEPEASSPSPGQQDATGQIVVVELPDKQPGPIIVNLTTQQTGGLEARNQNINLAGFEVLGAVRQFGDVSLTVSDDWQARWEMGSYVRQVDPTDLDSSLQSTNPTAAFQFDRQPWSLLVRIARRQLRVHVTPKFELECLRDEARLLVKLGYQVFGSRAFEFRIELNGWEMTGDPVESGSLVDQDRITVTPEGTLLLPLVQAPTRRAEVSFTLKRALNRDAAHLELPFPVPAADSIGTGELTVHSAPDVDLLPDLAGSTGLAAATSTSVADGTAVDGATDLHYRTLLPAAVFVAERTNRTREVTAESNTVVETTQDIAQIEMEFNYVVRFEPAAELSYELPTAVSHDPGDLEMRLVSLGDAPDSGNSDQGVLLHPVANPDDPSAVEPAVTRIVRTMLPRPGIGKFIVRIRYRVPVPKVARDAVPWTIPLIAPVDSRLTANRVTLEPPQGLAFGLDPQDDAVSWKQWGEATRKEGGPKTYQFVADRAELRLPLSIRATRPDATATTVVDRVWLQTWLASDVEQDRAAYQIRSTGKQLTIELPPDVGSSEVEVLVDRQPAEVLSRSPGRLVIRLQPVAGTHGGALATHTVELRWRRSYEHELVAHHRFTPPQIDEGSTALSQLYWQIVLPGDEHIVGAPESLISAHKWQWLGAFWGRQPLQEQSELEEWVGASPQLAPADGQNQYLFTGLLPVATIEVATAPRWSIVFVASATVLALICSWLYLPREGRRWLALAACAAMAILAVAYPTAGLLAAQAAVLGVVLSGIAFILARIRWRPQRPPGSAVVSLSSQRMLTPRAESILMPPFVATASTAPTTSLRMSEPER